MSEDSPGAVLRRPAIRWPHAAEDPPLMRIAVSNIAWTGDEDDQVESLLRDAGVDAIEAAPSRLFRGDARPSRGDVESVADRLERAGLELIAFQSLLYTRPEAALFGTAEQQRMFSDRIREVIDLAGRLRVGVLVLGSPRNRRRRPGMTSEEAFGTAVPVLRGLAGAASDAGTVLCIEPNPPQYGCDFITTPAEGAALVDAVDAPGFGLHLDTAGALLAGVDPAEAVVEVGGRTRHLHVSAPDLAEIEDEAVPHGRIADALRRTGYTGAASIEMRAAPVGENAARVRRAVAVTRSHYA